MKKILPILLTAVLLFSVLSGCAQEPKPYEPTGDGLSDGSGQTEPPKPEEVKDLNLIYYADRSMNPYKSDDFTNRALFSLIYQGLFSVDRNYQAQPVLCKNYEVSDDMQTYTLYLEQAMFSDGTPVTTADVVASLEAAKAGSYYGGRFAHIKSVSVNDAGALVFKMDTPFEDLPVLLDIPIVKASQVDDEGPIGSGPYIFERGETGKRLRRQAAWWCSSDTPVKAAMIPLLEAGSSSQIRDQFEFSNVSMVCADPGSENYVDFRCDYELWESETGMFLYLGVNSKSKVFGNNEIRRALTHLIDRDELVEDYFHGFAHAATLPASPLSPYYNDVLAERYGYAPQKFTDAVKAAQMEGKEIVLLVNKDDSRRLRTGRAIGRMLQSAGLKVTMKEKNTEDFHRALRNQDYDMYLGQTKLSPNMDLSPFYAPKGSLSYGEISSASLQAMCLEALANRGNYVTLHELAMEDAHICPILFRSYAIYAKRGLVSGLNPSRDNIFYYDVKKPAGK